MILALLLSCSVNPGLKAQKLIDDAKEVAEQAATPDLSCDANVKVPAPVGCRSGVLKCGDLIESTTVGGESHWDDDFYAQKFCFPAGSGHSAPERVFSMDMPEYTQVTIQLQTDCKDLDLVALSWVYEGDCPGASHTIFGCEGSNKRGWDKLVIQNFQARSYLIGVDGKGSDAGPFRLKVTCDHILRPEERVKF